MRSAGFRALSAPAELARKMYACKKFPSVSLSFLCQHFLPLQIYLRQFVFPPFAISAFLRRYNYNLLPPFPSSSFSLSLLLCCYCTSIRVSVACLRCLSSVVQHSGIPNATSLLLCSSLFSLSQHLRIRELLPLGAQGNNEVPAESGGSTAEDWLKSEARGGGGRLRDLFHLVLRCRSCSILSGMLQLNCRGEDVVCVCVCGYIGVQTHPLFFFSVSQSKCHCNLLDHCSCTATGAIMSKVFRRVWACVFATR